MPYKIYGYFKERIGNVFVAVFEENNDPLPVSVRIRGFCKRLNRDIRLESVLI